MNNNKNKSSKISPESIDQTPILSFWDRWSIVDIGHRIARSRTQLKFDGPNRVTIGRKPKIWLFESSFLIIGIIMLVSGLYFLLRIEEHYDEAAAIYMSIPLSMLFIVDGIRFSTKKFPTFDKKLGWVWLGKADATSILELQEVKKQRLNRIVAIQMIKAEKLAEAESWQSQWLYELNIVFDDLQRMNIQSHTEINVMTQNGKKLSEFLEVPFYQGML